MSGKKRYLDKNKYFSEKIAKNLLLDRTCNNCKDGNRQFFQKAYGHCLCYEERPEENTCIKWEGSDV